MRQWLVIRGWVGLLPLVWACGDTFISLSSDGRLEISITTSGDRSDPNGLTVVVDGGAARPVGPRGAIVLSDLSPGPHQVRLDGVVDPCRVDGANPRMLSVAADGRAAVRFTVVCDGTGGRRS